MRSHQITNFVVVAWVDTHVARHRTLKEASSYLEFLFSDAAQQLIGRPGYRPSKAQIPSTAGAQLSRIVLFPITAIARDWDDAQQRLFADDGIIDLVLKESRP